MATTRLHVDLSDISELPDKIEELKRAIVRWFQVGLSRFVFRRLQREIPVRTGRLRNSLRFRKLKLGGRFYFTKSGFYYVFQEGLEDRMIKVIERSLDDTVRWAIRKARQEVGI